MNFLTFTPIIISSLIGIVISHPITSENTDNSSPISPEKVKSEEIPGPHPPPSPENRGLYSNFYAEKMKEAKTTTSQVFAGQGAVTNINIEGSSANAGDLGEKFTHAVLKTAVALADTGIQAAQDIVKTVGGEIIEAFKM